MNYFKIVDLRSEHKFSLGHIPNSINVSKDSIFNYIENNVPDSVLVVLVSESGQLSGYISSLFWLARKLQHLFIKFWYCFMEFRFCH